VAYADELLQSQRDDLRIWYWKGAALFQSKRFVEAIEVFDEALSIDDQFADGWKAKAICLAEQGLHEQAIPVFAQALKRRPGDPIFLNEMAKSLAHVGRHTDAVDAFREAVAGNPRFAIAWQYLGLSLVRLEDYEDALRCLSRSIELDPHVADAWGIRGAVRMQLGADLVPAAFTQDDRARAISLLRDALQDLEQALGIDPNNEDAYKNRETLLRLAGPIVSPSTDHAADSSSLDKGAGTRMEGRG
jgi:tetratricopeptide (TPR) repeat protein